MAEVTQTCLDAICNRVATVRVRVARGLSSYSLQTAASFFVEILRVTEGAFRVKSDPFCQYVNVETPVAGLNFLARIGNLEPLTNRLVHRQRVLGFQLLLGFLDSLLFG